MIAALNSRIKALPPTAVLGLWTFDGHEGRSEVATGPLSDQVNGQPRSAALTAALDKQYSSGGGAVSFTTLRLIYQDMLANFRAGQANSVLVITRGAAHRPDPGRAGAAGFHPHRARTRPDRSPSTSSTSGATRTGQPGKPSPSLSGGSYQNSRRRPPRPRHGSQPMLA